MSITVTALRNARHRRIRERASLEIQASELEAIVGKTDAQVAALAAIYQKLLQPWGNR
jgi:hypothetical protein